MNTKAPGKWLAAGDVIGPRSKWIGEPTNMLRQPPRNYHAPKLANTRRLAPIVANRRSRSLPVATARQKKPKGAERLAAAIRGRSVRLLFGGAAAAPGQGDTDQHHNAAGDLRRA